jgi:hypothetical protein
MINSQVAVVITVIGALLVLGGIMLDADWLGMVGAAGVGFGLGAVLSHD